MSAAAATIMSSRTGRSTRACRHMSNAEYSAMLDQRVQATLAAMRQETIAQRTRRQAAWRHMWTSIWQALAIRLSDLELLEPDVCSEAAEELALFEAEQPDDTDDEGEDDTIPLPAAIAH